MRTVLDLIQEFATLSEAKTRSRGALPPDRERRWTELKRFYDILMSQDGLAERPVARYTSSQIREKISARSRLRVRTEMEIVVMGAGEIHHARVDNLSCGGVLLLCDHGFEVGTELTLQIASFIRGDALLPTKGTVVWRLEHDTNGAAFRFRIGVEFAGVGDAAQRSLDTLVVDSIETKLLCLRPELLDADFVQREQLRLG